MVNRAVQVKGRKDKVMVHLLVYKSSVSNDADCSFFLFVFFFLYQQQVCFYILNFLVCKDSTVLLLYTPCVLNI